ncbi:MAG TPA: hypothetical protein VMX74_10050, partial [Pirellulales bacterium]|nr:hypothetical protein [Pirellulales bacterium]
MADESPPIQANPATDKTLQFRLSTLFVLTLIASILAAFLSSLGSDMMLAGAVTIVASLLFAMAVGSFRPPLVDRIFWGVV